MQEVRLTDSDRTIFAICPECNKTGLGRKFPDYYSMAYSKKTWVKGPKCENCGTAMEYKYEVKIDGQQR